MDSTEFEYQRFLLAGHLLNYASRGLDSRKAYEMKNILERWFLSLYNEYGLPEKGELLPTPSDEEVDKKTANEIFEKGIRSTGLSAIEFIDDLWEQVDIFEIKSLASFSEATDRDIQVTFTHIMYKTFRYELSPRLKYLLANWSAKQVITMLLRYESILPGGQHWGIPWPVADILFNLGFRNEGFASPLNSRFLDKPDGKFCSLFKDVDAPFGSLGSFSSINLTDHPGNWMINPPYIESLFNIVLTKVNEFLEKTEGRRSVFILLPAWEDTRIFQELTKNRYLISREIMEKGTYYYHTPDQQSVTAPVKSVYFILGGERMSPEILLRIRESWRPAPFRARRISRK